MKLIQSVVLLFTLCCTSMAAWYDNTTSATDAINKSVITLSPTYTIQPVTTTITYADPTTTFYVTQTVFSTIYYTPVSTSTSITRVKSSQTSSLTTITTTSTSTAVTEFASIYSDISTTYTSTITSTLVFYQTITRTTKNNLNNKDLKVDFATSDSTTIQTNTTPATTTTTIAVTSDNTALPTNSIQQCIDIINTITVTETVNPVTITVTPEVKYVTVTVTANKVNQISSSNSTLKVY